MDHVSNTEPTATTELSIRDIDKLLRRMRADLRRIEQVTARKDKAIARIEARENDRIEALEKSVREHAQLIDEFAQSHRDKLTENGERQSYAGRSGTLQWQIATGIVDITVTQEECIAALKKARLGKLIKVQETPDKKAIREQRELIEERKVKGINFVNREYFTIKPAGKGGSVRRDIAEANSWTLNFPKKK